MDAFAPTPPGWIQSAEHAQGFCCPICQASAAKAQKVWINRRSPVYTLDHHRKWQEFYQCECNAVWWAWSSDRPPADAGDTNRSEAPTDDIDFF